MALDTLSVTRSNDPTPPFETSNKLETLLDAARSIALTLMVALCVRSVVPIGIAGRGLGCVKGAV